MRKRIFTLVLCAALVLCAVPVQVYGDGSTGFSDVPGNIWYEYALTQMLKNTPGIIDGYPDGLFHPDEVITRGQFLKMIVTAAEEGHTIDRGKTAVHWAYPYYATALDNNVLVADVFSRSEGGSSSVNSSEPIFPGTQEALDAPISRYEMAVIASNVCTNMLMEKTVIVSDASAYITDYASISSKYTTAVEQTFGKGLLEGYTDGSFGGEHNLNRCEAAMVIYRLLWAKERQKPDWAEEQPLEAAPVATGSGFYGYKSFALWLRDGHVDAWGNIDATARAYLFGEGTAAAARGYFASSAEAQPYMEIITVPIWTIDKTGNKYPSTATMSVNRVLAQEVRLIFQQIYNDAEKFPIYGGWALGCARFSDTMRHSWGAAIDVNPYYNCECNFGAGYLRVTCGYGWMPPGVTEWKGRAISAYQGSMSWENSVYSISPYGSVVKAFADYGWGWGGSWGGTSYDFMHFSVIPSGG